MTAPPKHLSAERRKLWASILSTHELEAHEFELLRLACEALDSADDARRRIEADGLVVAGQSGPRLHPAYPVERDSRLAAARLLRQLGLTDDMPTPPNRRHRAPDRMAR